MLDELRDYGTNPRHEPAGVLAPNLNGKVHVPDSFVGPTFIGAFPLPIPQGQPIAGALLTTSYTYCMGPVPDGDYYVLAAAFPPTNNLLDYLLPKATLYVGTSPKPVMVRCGQASNHAGMDIWLRPIKPTDPPILIALPFLLIEYMKTARPSS